MTVVYTAGGGDEGEGGGAHSQGLQGVGKRVAVVVHGVNNSGVTNMGSAADVASRQRKISDFSNTICWDSLDIYTTPAWMKTFVSQEMF